MRSVPEWIGRADDERVPDRVRLRLFQGCGGHCRKCTRKLTAGDIWDVDHVKALGLGGEHRESNLQVLCGWCHSSKTFSEIAAMRKADRAAKKHVGLRKRPKRKWAIQYGKWHKDKRK